MLLIYIRFRKEGQFSLSFAKQLTLNMMNVKQSRLPETLFRFLGTFYQISLTCTGIVVWRVNNYYLRQYVCLSAGEHKKYQTY